MAGRGKQPPNVATRLVVYLSMVSWGRRERSVGKAGRLKVALRMHALAYRMPGGMPAKSTQDAMGVILQTVPRRAILRTGDWSDEDTARTN